MNDVIIRHVTSEDAEALFALRLEALKTNPEAFGSDYETTLAQETTQTYASRIPSAESDNAIICAEVDGELVGVMGFVRSTRMKTKHMGDIWGVYVQPEVRGKGISKQLMQATLRHARSCDGLLQVNLTVITENLPAIKLYQKFGFTIWGTQPNALKVHGKLYEEHWMSCVIE